MEFDQNTMKKLLKDQGAEGVSDGAAEQLAETIEMFIGYISEEAGGRARDHKRKVINEDDIRQALE